jgi:hypothetical protein
MSYFRSYFEKNNTIIKNLQVNTAKNPTTEILYGSSFSKFIFKIDLTDLQSKIDNGDLIIDSNTKHYLKMTNTIFGDEGFRGQNRSSGRDRAVSFNLIVFEVPEFWDEGTGFDYEDGGYDYTTGNKTFDVRPSNWFHKNTLDEWTVQGVYATEPIIINTVHFDNGTENLNVDITDYINGILISGNTNNGLGLAFDVLYQDLSPEVDQSIAFFTKYTQTFFEPFLETTFENRIIDSRYNFIEKQEQNLYLYVTKGTNFYDLDELPIVDILNSNSTPILGLGNIQAVKVRKGVYKITFGLDGVTCDGKRFYFDCWRNLILDGVEMSDVCQKFIPKPYTNLFTIGENPTDTQKYVVQFNGIRQSEKIKSGEVRKIVVTMKSIDYPKPQIFDEVYYRMYVKEGRTEVIIHDWTLLDVTNENSFFMDTSCYIPREYFMEIKSRTHGEEIYHNESIKFEIVSEK